MNARRSVLICGTFSALLWAILSALTFGFPPWAVAFLKACTLNLFPDAIAKTASGFAYEVPNQDLPTVAYLVLHFLLFALSIIAAITISRSSPAPKTLAAVLLFGALFRALVIPSTPIHENDFYRYLWDGKSAAHGVNPFLFPPSQVEAKADPLGALFANPLAIPSTPAHTPVQNGALDALVNLRDSNRELHARIGHPNIPTIYPPVSQASFLVSHWLTGDSIVGWKIFVVLFDLATCALIAFLLKALGRDPSMTILYAWCPLVIKEFANSGHLDSIPIFFTILAVYLAVRNRQTSATVSLAAGTLGKFVPLPLLPILVPPSISTAPWLRYLIFATLIAVAYVPFLLWQAAGFTAVFAGLGTYSREWQFFSSVFTVIHHTINAFNPHPDSTSLFPAKIITASLFLAIIAYATFKGFGSKDAPPTYRIVKNSFFVLAAFFLLNACAFPWYFTWVVPFLCIFPHPAWLALGALLPLTYLSFHPAESIPLASANWLGFPALSWIIWGTFAAIALGLAIIHRSGGREQPLETGNREDVWR